MISRSHEFNLYTLPFVQRFKPRVLSTSINKRLKWGESLLFSLCLFFEGNA